MSESILISVKRILGMDEQYTVFDLDVMTHINSVFNTLTQLNVGPKNGFMIEDASAKWEDFLGNDINLNAVKSYVCLRVKVLFDPPSTSFHLSAIENQCREMEWRLSVYADPPVSPTIIEE